MRSSVRLKNDEGYTLTEMLVVIAMIALIAAILTPQLIGQMARSRAKTAQLQLDTVAAAIESFRSDVGRYPSQQEGVTVLLRDTTGLEGWTGPYLKDGKQAQDPWNRDLTYTFDNNAQTFSVGSLGSDGKAGGTGTARDLRSPATPVS